MFTKKSFFAFSALLLCALSPAYASEDSAPQINPASGTPDIIGGVADTGTFSETQATHPAISVTMDKSELIRLDREAASIIVGNPAHINVLAENPQMLVVVPKAPGTTFMSVLDAQGEIIMQRHVIVAAPTAKYVRVRKSCAASGDDACQSTQTYYCPDMCHEIAPVAASEGSGSAADAAGTAAQSGADVGDEGGANEENSEATTE